MNPRPIKEARTPLLALALPALRRARIRAEEVARSTHTSLVFVRSGRVVTVPPEDLAASPGKIGSR